MWTVNNIYLRYLKKSAFILWWCNAICCRLNADDDCFLKQLYYCLTCLMCSTNSFLSPLYFVFEGPLSSLLALTRSLCSEERQRANTDSPGKGNKYKNSVNCSLVQIISHLQMKRSRTDTIKFQK